MVEVALSAWLLDWCDGIAVRRKVWLLHHRRRSPGRRVFIRLMYRSIGRIFLRCRKSMRSTSAFECSRREPCCTVRVAAGYYSPLVLSHERIAWTSSVFRSSGSQWPAGRFVTERSLQVRCMGSVRTAEGKRSVVTSCNDSLLFFYDALSNQDPIRWRPA
jgi:hypothetical protein